MSRVVFLSIGVFAYLIVAADWFVMIAYTAQVNPTWQTVLLLVLTLYLPVYAFRVVYDDHFCYCSPQRRRQDSATPSPSGASSPETSPLVFSSYSQPAPSKRSKNTTKEPPE